MVDLSGIDYILIRSVEGKNSQGIPRSPFQRFALCPAAKIPGSTPDFFLCIDKNTQIFEWYFKQQGFTPDRSIHPEVVID